MLSEFHMKREGGGQASQLAQLDHRFHKVLYEASDSRRLGRILLDFHHYIQQSREESVRSQERARRSIREHRLILRALHERDADHAEQLASEHVLNAMANLD
jgi:DNA-binding GntR family transcriptional regulator